MKRILLIILPVVAVVIVFVVAFTYYSRPQPTQTLADSYAHRVPASTPSITPIPITPPTDTGTADVPAKSGIMGTVTIGPTCPGPVHADDDGKCADKPYAATVWVMTADGTRVVTSFTSDAQGQFKVTLPAGTYILSQAAKTNTAKYPVMIQQTVVVRANKFTTVNIQFDTGIR